MRVHQESEAFKLQSWIEESKEKLKPPVGNAQSVGRRVR